jgi:hypothetical protein
MPANTSVFTGADGSISLAAVEGPEGEQAKAVLTDLDLIAVGRVQGVRVEVQSTVRPYHEIGQRYPTQLRSGNVTVRGTIERAHINGAMLRLQLGQAASSRPGGSWVQPSFNISLLIQNPALPDSRSTLTLHGVKIDNWVYKMPEDDFLMESVGFQALYITVEDEG